MPRGASRRPQPRHFDNEVTRFPRGQTIGLLEQAPHTTLIGKSGLWDYLYQRGAALQQQANPVELPHRKASLGIYTLYPFDPFASFAGSEICDRPAYGRVRSRSSVRY
jgi:hypothetical protein